MSRAQGATPLDDDVAWRAWTPGQVAQRLAGVRGTDGRPVRWAVAGGWALDLYLGRVTREHEDLEIVVLGDDVPAVLAAFPDPDWTWRVPADGWLHPLDSPAVDETHQTWLWSVAEAAFVLDVFRDAHDGDTWLCRRDPTITRLWASVVGSTRDGVPYLAPEIVLLFKAKHARAKDLADLRVVLPALDAAARRWLREALERVHPRHHWVALVGPARRAGGANDST